MPTTRLNHNKFPWRDVLILTVLFGFFFGFMLGNRPLSVPDEGRYAEIPREMAASGDYLTPRLNGVKYLEKPPLVYWLGSASIRAFGATEGALRLWPAVFALLGCLAVYGAGRRMYGREAGLAAGIVLATCPLYYGMSRLLTLDMPVSFFLTAALLLFLLGVREASGRKRRLLLYGFYACAALATLTKGLIGIVIPAMVIGAWIAILNEWRTLKNIHLVSGTLLFLLIAAPWHIMVAEANPEFVRFYFVREHFQRYLTKIHGHFKPFWYFIPVLLGGLYPWSAFLVQGLKRGLPAAWRGRHQDRESLFLMLWAGLVFFFFSASDSKLLPYILPAVPPLALLIGRYLADARDRREAWGLRAGYRAVLLIGMILAAGFFIAPSLRGVDVPLSAVRLHLGVMGLITAGGAGVVWLFGRTSGHSRAFVTLAASAAAVLMISNTVLPGLDTRTVKGLAQVLKARLRPGDEVMSYNNYYQDLPVYLGRRITVVNWKGELAFGTMVEDVSAWMIDEAEFQKRWCGPNTAYLLTDRTIYDTLRNRKDLLLYPVAQNARTILVCNQEVKP